MPQLSVEQGGNNMKLKMIRVSMKIQDALEIGRSEKIRKIFFSGPINNMHQIIKRIKVESRGESYIRNLKLWPYDNSI